MPPSSTQSMSASESKRQSLVRIYVYYDQQRNMVGRSETLPAGQNRSRKHPFKDVQKSGEDAILLLILPEDGPPEWAFAESYEARADVLKAAKRRALEVYLNVSDSLREGNWPQGLEMSPIVKEEILPRLTSEFQARCQKIVTNHKNKGEERLTGILTDDLEILGGDLAQSWSIKMLGVEMSAKSKEPCTGADVALILFYSGPEGEGRKTIWLQAKRATKVSAQIGDLTKIDADLADQVTAMRKVTRASFPLVYAPDGVFVAKELSFENDAGKIAFPEFVADAFRCVYGDQSPAVYYESVNKTYFFYIGIEAIDMFRKDLRKIPNKKPGLTQKLAGAIARISVRRRKK